MNKPFFNALTVLNAILFLTIWVVFTASAQIGKDANQNFRPTFKTNLSLKPDEQNNLAASSFNLKPQVYDKNSKFPASDSATQSKFVYERPSARKRFQKYVNRTIGVNALIVLGAGAGIAHATDSPEEWEDDFKGFGRRFASNLGENAIRQTTIYGLDEAFRVDSAFYKKGKGEKFKVRLANAVVSVFTARTASGRRVVGFPRIIGAYASGIIAKEVWFPKRFDYKDGLRDGTISLGIGAGVNVLREFFFGKR